MYNRGSLAEKNNIRKYKRRGGSWAKSTKEVKYTPHEIRKVTAKDRREGGVWQEKGTKGEKKGK